MSEATVFVPPNIVISACHTKLQRLNRAEAKWKKITKEIDKVRAGYKWWRFKPWRVRKEIIDLRDQYYYLGMPSNEMEREKAFLYEAMALSSDGVRLTLEGAEFLELIAFHQGNKRKDREPREKK